MGCVEVLTRPTPRLLFNNCYDDYPIMEPRPKTKHREWQPGQRVRKKPDL